MTASHREVARRVVGMAPDRWAARLDSALAQSVQLPDSWSRTDQEPIMSTANVAVAIDDLPSRARVSIRGWRA